MDDEKRIAGVIGRVNADRVGRTFLSIMRIKYPELVWRLVPHEPDEEETDNDA